MSPSRRRWLARSAVVVVTLLIAVWWWRQPSDELITADLVELFMTAEKRSTLRLDLAFNVSTQRIRGEAKRAIFMHPTSRLTYRGVQVPRHGLLRAWVALKEDAWDRSTDGVLFRVGVSTTKYDELASRHVDPRNNVDDRRWVPLEIDLSAYGGRTVDLILNTNTSPPGGGNDPSSDFAVWGEPEIVARTRGSEDTASAAP